MIRITVFTPTYNRANTLPRVFDALRQQTYKDFEWIIVDDGSSDSTKEVVHRFMQEAKFPISYYFQKNSGKHVALNFAVTKAKGEFFVVSDSDDACTPNALETFINTWDTIPENEKKKYKAIIAQTMDDQGKVNGKYPQAVFDANDLDAFFKIGLRFEKWNFTRTEVFKEFPFPVPSEHLHYYPETILWWKMARKYQNRYIDIPLRYYIRDQGNAVTMRQNSRCHESYYYWLGVLNLAYDYFLNLPLFFIKAEIALAYNSRLTQRKFKDTFSAILPKRNYRTFYRLLFALFYPLGTILSSFKK